MFPWTIATHRPTSLDKFIARSPLEHNTEMLSCLIAAFIGISARVYLQQICIGLGTGSAIVGAGSISFLPTGSCANLSPPATAHRNQCLIMELSFKLRVLIGPVLCTAS